MTTLSQDKLAGVVQSGSGMVGTNPMYEQYFCLKPINNDMLTLLEDLKNYRVKLINLEDELSKRKITSLP